MGCKISPLRKKCDQPCARQLALGNSHTRKSATHFALAQARQRQGKQTKVLAQGKSQARAQAIDGVCNPAWGKARPALRKAGRTRQLPPRKNKCDPLCTGSGEAKTRKPYINPRARQVALDNSTQGKTSATCFALNRVRQKQGNHIEILAQDRSHLGSGLGQARPGPKPDPGASRA